MKLTYRTPKNAAISARYWGKSLDRPDWFRVANEERSASGPLEIYIYDVIGWPFNDVEELVRKIADNRDREILLHINSPGGDVFDGMALYNGLRNHTQPVTTKIEGLAASMASVVALAGTSVQMHQNAMLMIHEPWAFVLGNQFELREIADLLGKLSANILHIYQRRTQSETQQLQEQMRDETWFSAEEAEEQGFLDQVIAENAGEQARFDTSMYAHSPTVTMPKGRDLTPREMERALRDAGASRSFAKKAVAKANPALRDADLDDVKTAVEQLIASVKGQG